MNESTKVPQEYYAAIGRIADGWAYFEVLINHAIWELANVEQHAGACITAHIGAPIARFKALVSLLKYRGCNDAHIKSLNSLSGTADELGQKRNRIIHDVSAVSAKTGEFTQLRITADRTLVFQPTPVPMSELTQVAERISKLIKECGSAIQEAINSLPAYDKTQFSQSQGISPDRHHSEISKTPTNS